MAVEKSEVSRQEYLKRYLSSENDTKKKKLKKKKLKAPPTKRAVGFHIIDDNIDMKDIEARNQSDNQSEDELPVVAEVIDERPKIVQIREQYNSSQWKRLGSDDSGNEESVKAHQHGSLTGKPQEDVTGATVKLSQFENRTKQRYDSDSDCSPPRKTSYPDNGENSKHSGTTIQDQDLNVPRKPHSRLPNKHNSDHSSDSDISVKRSRFRDSSSDGRKSRFSEETAVNFSSRHESRHHSKNSDTLQSSHQRTRRHSDSDLSPERLSSSIQKESGKLNQTNETNSALYQNSDSDYSPPRKTSSSRHESPTSSGFSRVQKKYSKSKSKATVVIKKEPCDSLLAHQETAKMQKEKLEASDKYTEKVFLRGKEEKEEEAKRKKEEQKLAEKNAKYSKWGKGVEQEEQQSKKFEMDLYEMSKPLARYQDDDDLNQILKDREREGDPMLEYMQKKKKNQKTGGDVPRYQGPPAPPNRFGILPGYRWDGVDRSNGFEKKYYEKINNTTSKDTESYLWSVQDM